jgi:hypothetical protein
LEANGSLISMAMTFQSVSPSSKRAMTPKILTCLIWPTWATCSPISMTSMGSLSPRALVSGWEWLGSSQVYDTRVTKLSNESYNNNYYLRESTIVPNVTLVREAVTDISKLTLLGILNDGVHGNFLADLYVCRKFLINNRNTRLSCQPTSSLALDQRGISTTMLKMVFSSLAKRGMSWKGETGTPFFSIMCFYDEFLFWMTVYTYIYIFTLPK